MRKNPTLSEMTNFLQTIVFVGMVGGIGYGAYYLIKLFKGTGGNAPGTVVSENEVLDEKGFTFEVTGETVTGGGSDVVTLDEKGFTFEVIFSTEPTQPKSGTGEWAPTYPTTPVPEIPVPPGVPRIKLYAKVINYRDSYKSWRVWVFDPYQNKLVGDNIWHDIMERVSLGDVAPLYKKITTYLEIDFYRDDGTYVRTQSGNFDVPLDTGYTGILAVYDWKGQYTKTYPIIV